MEPVLENNLNSEDFTLWKNSPRYQANDRPIRTMSRCINYPGEKTIQKFKSLGEEHCKKNIVYQMAYKILKDHIETSPWPKSKVEPGPAPKKQSKTNM